MLLTSSRQPTKAGSSVASPGCRRFRSRDDTTAIVTRRVALRSRVACLGYVAGAKSAVDLAARAGPPGLGRSGNGSHVFGARVGTQIGGGVRSAPDEGPDLYLAFALYQDHPPR